MTKMIDETIIPVGKELDLAIADKIFGIKKVYYGEWDTDKEYPEYIPSGKPWRTHQIDAKPIPHFSTNPDAAYVLKLKMAKKYHWLIKSPFAPDLQWIAGLTPLNVSGWNGNPDFVAHGNTEMEAVCRVALFAISNENEDK